MLVGLIYDAPTVEQREFFGLRYTKWDSPVGNWDSLDSVCNSVYASLKEKKESIAKLVDLIEDNNISIDYNGTNQDNWVNLKTNNSFVDDIQKPIDALRELFAKYDSEGMDIFEAKLNSLEFYKIALLIADKYREDINYPMDKEDSNQSRFYRAYFADATINYARDNNKYQKDLGDFSPNLDELLALDTQDGTITLTPSRFDDWTTSGFYAKPGTTITIKREDSSDNLVKVKFNMQRVNTTRMWEKNSYSRPRFIQSNAITIEKGKEYNISTPYGGAIYIYWQGKENAQPFTLSFKNILKHPTLIANTINIDDNTATNYLSELDNSIFNWTDIKTPFLEIHSLKSKQLEAFNDPHYNGDLNLYFSDLKKYLIEDDLKVAGYIGAGLNRTPSMQDWCENEAGNFGIDCNSAIHQRPKIQHINVDYHAQCGAACSGNPFDMTEPLTIFSGVAVHEYGHNLQRNLLKFYGWYSTEVTNNIFTQYVATQYAKDHNKSYTDYAWSYFKEAYDILEDAIANNIEAKEGIHPMWQNVETHQQAPQRQVLISHLAFMEGWDIFTKLYLFERSFKEALKSENDWNAKKDALGFSDYSYDEAKALTNWQNIIAGNDFMAIVLNKITNKDFRDYFKAWGIRVSDKASSQIDNNGFSSVVEPKFFLFRDDNILPVTPPSKTLPLDGAKLNLTKAISTVCNGTGFDECKDSAIVYEYEGDIEFKSIFDDNLDSNISISENTLRAIAKDENNNTKTISIESVHRQFRKLTKTKGAFPNENSLMKLLYMGIQNASKKWTMPVWNWSLTLSQLAIFFEGRLDKYLEV